MPAQIQQTLRAAALLVGRLALTWLIVGSSHAVLAQAGGTLPNLQYEAPSACPSQRDFVERVRARLSADGARVPAGVALRVVLAAQGAGMRGTVEVTRGATRTQRSVESRRCEDVVEALALIAALALREHAVRDLDSARGRHAHAQARARAGQVDRPLLQPGNGKGKGNGDAADPANPDDTRGAGTREPEPASENSDARTPEGERADTAAAESGETPAAAETDGPDDEHSARQPAPPALLAAEPSAPTRAWQLEAGLGASFMVFRGLGPALQPGLQLQAALALRSESFTWSLQLGGRIARTQSVAAQGGSAWFKFASGVARLCATSRLGASPFGLSGCAVAEPGVFSTGGVDLANSRSHSRRWLAFGAAVDLSFSVVRWLSAHTGAELLAPVRRDRVLLGGDTLYRIPALGLRVHVGLEIPFR